MKGTKTKAYLLLCMYVLSKNPFMFMHIYLILGQDTIMLQWSLIFLSSTIRMLILLGKLSNHPIYELYTACFCFWWSNITHLFHMHFFQTQTLTPWNFASFYKYYCFISILFLSLSYKWTNSVAKLILPHWCIGVLE